MAKNTNNNFIESKANNWKVESKAYIRAMETFLDKASNIGNDQLKREVIECFLKCDSELTVLSERLFEKYYKQGYNEAKKNG